MTYMSVIMPYIYVIFSEGLGQYKHRAYTIKVQVSGIQDCLTVHIVEDGNCVKTLVNLGFMLRKSDYPDLTLTING